MSIYKNDSKGFRVKQFPVLKHCKLLAMHNIAVQQLLSSVSEIE